MSSSRHRLVTSVEAGECSDTTTPSQKAIGKFKPASRERIVEHYNQLVQLYQISVVIRQMQEIVDDMVAMAASSKNKVTFHLLKRAI